MLLTYYNNQFSLTFPYSEANVAAAKEAGFQWDKKNKTWFSTSVFAAESFRKYGDEASIKRLDSFDKLRTASLALTRGTEFNEDFPAPEGLSYLPYQKAGIAYAVIRPATLIADPMGLGKTIEAIGVINLLCSKGRRPKSILIVCPSAVKTNWARELRKWLIEDFTIGIARAGQAFPLESDITIVNYELLHERGKSKHSELREELAIQYFDLLLADECLPPDTLVETEIGPIRIDKIVDNRLPVRVLSCNLNTGEWEYRNISRHIKTTKPIGTMGIINYDGANGRLLITSNHRVYTKNRGYIRADEVRNTDLLCVLRNSGLDSPKGSVYRSLLQSLMHVQRDIIKARGQTQTIRVPYEAGIKSLMRTMWNCILEETSSKILLNKMLGYLEKRTTRTESIVGEKGKGKYLAKGAKKPASQGENDQAERRSGLQREGNAWNRGMAQKQPLVLISGRERAANHSAAHVTEAVGISNRIPDLIGKGRRSLEKLAFLLQSRLGPYRYKNSDRGGREISPFKKVAVSGPQKNRSVSFPRVDGFTLYQPGSAGQPGFNSRENHHVYNLEVEGNHNYIANNVLVSNCHVIKNAQSIRSQVIKKIDCKMKIALSGTPFLNRPSELWSVLQFLDPKTWDNYLYYHGRYCGPKASRWAKSGYDYSGASNLDELQYRLRASLMVRRDKSEVLKDLPSKFRQIIELPADEYFSILKEESRETTKFDGLMAKLYSELDIAEATDDESEYKKIVRSIKQAQSVHFTAMALLRKKAAVAKIPAVVERVKNILEENPSEKILLFAHHHEVIEKLHEAFPEISVVFYGETNDKDREIAERRFNDEDRCRIFIGGIRAAGVGLNLQAASIIVFAEIDWVPGIMNQAEGRAHRMGQEKNVLVSYVLLENSIDAKMIHTIIKKQDVLDAALDNDIPEEMPVTAEVRTVEPAVKTKLDSIAVKLESIDVKSVHNAIIMIAKSCDYASSWDAVGFNKVDSHTGHSLAKAKSLTPKQAALGLLISHKYRKQLPETARETIEEIWSKVCGG